MLLDGIYGVLEVIVFLTSSQLPCLPAGRRQAGLHFSSPGGRGTKGEGRFF